MDARARRAVSAAADPGAPEAVVAGHVCLDLVCRVGGPSVRLEPGGLMEVAGTRISTGGIVANSGLALQRLGVRTRLMGAVGDDAFGEVLRTRLAEEPGVDVAGIATVDGAATSYSLVLTPPDGERMFIHEPGANASFDADAVDLDLVEGAKVLHFGYPPLMPRLYAHEGAALATFLERARGRGVTVSLDTAMPDPASAAARADWSAILRRALPHTDLFMPSLAELVAMLPELWSEGGNAAATDAGPGRAAQADRVSRLADALLGMGAKMVLIKLGAEGAYLRTAGADALGAMGPARPGDLETWAERELWAPSLQARVVSTVGAGDATCAGFLTALLRGLEAEEALATATAVGGACVEAPDAVSAIPDWETCRRRLRQGWPANPLAIPVPGWRRAGRYQLWRGPRDRSS